MTVRKGLLTSTEVAFPLLVIVLVWVWSVNSGIYYFPGLPDVLARFADNWLFARLLTDALPSLLRLLLGYSIAAIVGIVLGMFLGQAPRVRALVSPLLEFLRAIPAPALIPFVLLVLGIGDNAKIVLIAFVCFWPILLNATDGVRGMEPTYNDTAAVYGIGWWQRQVKVLLPAAAPQIFAGMRTALSLALIMVVVSEMVSSTNGVGFFVLQAQRSFAIADMWSGIILIGLFGYLLNLVFVLVESRVLAWHRGAKARAE